MRTHVSSCLVVVLAGMLSAASLFGQTTGEARKSYDAAIQGAKRNFLKCDAEALASGVTEDYTGVNLGGVTKGRAAELQGQRAFCAANTVTAWDATTTDFHSSGPLAWAAGTLSMTYTVKATGKVETKEGRYLATYVRHPDGTWFQQYFMAVPITPAKP